MPRVRELSFGHIEDTCSLYNPSSPQQTKLNQDNVKRDIPPSSSGNTHQWHTGILGC